MLYKLVLVRDFYHSVRIYIPSNLFKNYSKTNKIKFVPTYYVCNIMPGNLALGCELRYIYSLMIDYSSKLSPDQDPTVWQIPKFEHFR